MVSVMTVLSQCVVVWCVLVTLTVGDEENSLSTHEPRKKQHDILSNVIPVLAMPFITQTILLPLVLFFMKFTLLKSIFLGKLGVILWIVNILRNRLKEQEGGFYSHNVNILHNNYHSKDLRF